MKKRELVHLHALLSRTRRFVRRRERIPENTFERYEAVGVAPQAVYESKGVHEEAVVELATALVDAIEDAGEAEPRPETPGSEDAADEQPLGATND